MARAKFSDMRKNVISAAVCAGLLSVGAPVASVAWAQEPGDAEADGLNQVVCKTQYNAEQIPALAAGVLLDDALVSTSRREVLQKYRAKKTELEKGLSQNGWGTYEFAPIEEVELGVVEDTEYNSSSMLSGDVARIAGLDGTENAYFYNANVWTQKVQGLCGKEMNVPAPREPLGLRGEGLALPVTGIAGIVAALVAVLGAGAAWAGLIPGLTLPF